MVPLTPTGVRILCSTGVVSGTIPRISPSATLSPFLTFGVKCHFFFLSRGVILTPLFMNAPVSSQSAISENSKPSKIFPIKPGPNSAKRGIPVDTTGSPGLKPLVFS